MRVTVCAAADLPPGSSTVVSAGAREYAVFNADGDIVAIDNRCAHKGQPLATGVVRRGIVTCPAHLWRYDVRTGERVDAPGVRQLCVPVAVEDGVIRLEVPEPRPRQPIREMLLEHAREWSRDE